MLARAAGDVKNGSTLRIDPSQQIGDLRGFPHVVLEGGENEVVVLSGRVEHV